MATLRIYSPDHDALPFRLGLAKITWKVAESGNIVPTQPGNEADQLFRQLQKLLGVAQDGVIGPATHMAVTALGSSVTSACGTSLGCTRQSIAENIEAIINAVAKAKGITSPIPGGTNKMKAVAIGAAVIGGLGLLYILSRK